MAADDNTDGDGTPASPWRLKTPPLMERLGLAEVEHNPRGNRLRAI